MQDKLEDRIKNYCKQMHEYNKPEEIEKLKRVMKKNVKIFERNSLLAYLLLMTSTDSISFKPKTQGRQPQDMKNSSSSISGVLWTNAYFYDDKGREDFINFVSNTSHINPQSIKSIKKIKNYSFMEVEPSCCDKIVKAFSNPVAFGKIKVSIKPAKKETK